ncbi:MAG: macro domain-containing protein [Nitrospinota bacterium]
MRQRQVSEGRIVLERGDITESAVDAVVNAANDQLWMGAGVAGAIRRKGGKEIEREAVAKGPIPVGEAVATGAGALKARYVIHAAAMGQDLRTDSPLIEAATRNSLLRAEELSLESVAFPALGTGVGGFPPEEAARAMMRAMAAHLKGPGRHVKTVTCVLFTEEHLAAFERALDELEV